MENNQNKKIALTGVKPTGVPHIGNYFGAIKPAIELSRNSEYQSYYFIADYHALNFIKTKQELQDYTRQIACTWLACGLDPKKVVFFKQSDITEVTELNWLLNNVTSKGLMNRAHAYKALVDKSVAEGGDPDALVNMGLYCYPILMAADILLYSSKYVPVGQDQKQHVEMARDIAKAFNKRYGYTFVMPEPLITPEVATIVGTDGRKMSKSYGNTIPLFCESAKLKKLIAGIVTDSTPPDQPKSTNCALFSLYKLFASPQQAEQMAAKYAKGISWADAKAELYNLAESVLAPMREKYNYYIEHYSEVEKILADGAKKARKIAKETISRARANIGLNIDN